MEWFYNGDSSRLSVNLLSNLWMEYLKKVDSIDTNRTFAITFNLKGVIITFNEMKN